MTKGKHRINHWKWDAGQPQQRYGRAADDDGYNNGDSAVNIDGNIIVFQDNINTAIALGNYTDAKIAAVSPMHELLHTELKKLGLVKDGKISAYAVQGVRGLFNMVEQKFKDGKIIEVETGATKIPK